MNLFGAMRAPASTAFGVGQRKSLPGFARALGQRVLLVTDGRLEAEPDFTAMVDALKAAGQHVAVFADVEPELPDNCVIKGLSAGRRSGADVIVGIGGGSCIDAAKFIALLLAHGGSPADYYGEFKVAGPVAPLIAIPTTAGTGSEVTPVAVIADGDRPLKVGVASPFLIPRVAICDPELTYSCPPSLTAASGADALTHAVEAFTTVSRPFEGTTVHEHVFVGKNALSDHFALEAIARIGGSLERAVENGDDQDARQEMMYGSLLAGLAFGVAGTSAAHAIQYPVGALTNTSHGIGVAVLLPFVMEFNRRHSQEELSLIANALGVDQPDATSDLNAQTAIDRIRDICETIGIPPTLEALGLKEDQIEWATKSALGAVRLTKNNPRLLDHESMRLLIEAAFRGTSAALHS